MSVLEGIGDEVVISGAVLLLLLLFYLGWMIISLPVQHSPATRVYVNHFESQHPRVQEVEEENIQDSGIDISTAEQHDAEQGVVAHSSQNNNDVSMEDEDADTTRKRRLEFFNNPSSMNETPISNGSLPMMSDAPHHTDEEGSEVDSEVEAYEIRLKYLDDTERTVNARPATTIADFKRLHFLTELENNQTVRLIYHGQVLQDERTLTSYGLTNGCCVHVQVINRINAERRADADNETELDLSQFLWPLLGVFLGVLWMLHFQYREYFATSSTVALFGLSGLFLTVVWGQYTSSRPEQERR